MERTDAMRSSFSFRCFSDVAARFKPGPSIERGGAHVSGKDAFLKPDQQLGELKTRGIPTMNYSPDGLRHADLYAPSLQRHIVLADWIDHGHQQQCRP